MAEKEKQLKVGVKVYPKLYQECDYCGARISDGLYQSIVVQLVDTEEEEVLYFCSRRCRRAFDRRLTKVMGRVGFDSELSKLGGAMPPHTTRSNIC